MVNLFSWFFIARANQKIQILALSGTSIILYPIISVFYFSVPCSRCYFSVLYFCTYPIFLCPTFLDPIHVLAHSGVAGRDWNYLLYHMDASMSQAKYSLTLKWSGHTKKILITLTHARPTKNHPRPLRHLPEEKSISPPAFVHKSRVYAQKNGKILDINIAK
jgi:hypothetical protein